MNSRFAIVVASCCLLWSCDKEDGGKEDGGKDESKADQGDSKSDKGHEKTGEATKTSPAEDTKTSDDDAKSAVGDYPGAITECPKELSGRVDKDRLITKECGVVKVTGSVRVENASLILAAGASLAFDDGTDLMVGYAGPGKLIVEGTEAEPVVFTSAGDKAPGVWKGVRLAGKANRSSIDGLVIEYGGDNRGSLEVLAQDVVVKNSTIRHVKEVAIVAESNEARFSEFSNNAFEDVGKVAMRVSPIVAGDIAVDNDFGDGAEVHIKGARLQESTTWHAIAAPFVVVREVRVEGKDATRAWLDVEAGTQVMFDGDGAIMVGYAAEGGLRLSGTSDKPVTLSAHERKEPGAWRGLSVQSKGEVELTHVKLSHGGKKDRDGALLLTNGSRAKVEHVTFADNAVGMVVDHADSELETFVNNTFSGTPIAIRLAPARWGALGEGNRYESDARILVARGTVTEDMKMVLQPGAKVELEGAIRLDKGTHEFPAGYIVHVKDGSKVDVGYVDIATVKLMGTEDKPVKFVGLRDEPGSWDWIKLHPKAKGNVIEHVVLRNAGTPAGLMVERDADAKIDHLSCEKCEGATLERHKDAKVEVGEVKAAEGTPKAE